MSRTATALLCRNQYDPLDRLVTVLRPGVAALQRFHSQSHAVSETDGVTHLSLFQYDGRVCAQQHHSPARQQALLLAFDGQLSVLGSATSLPERALAYTPYGFRHAQATDDDLPGFHGERYETITAHYLLGNGYRAFNPVLMRFNAPDSWSPFGDGGINAYAYCQGDPINRFDPSGHGWLSFGRRLFGRGARPASPATGASHATGARPASAAGTHVAESSASARASSAPAPAPAPAAVPTRPERMRTRYRRADPPPPYEHPPSYESLYGLPEPVEPPAVRLLSDRQRRSLESRLVEDLAHEKRVLRVIGRQPVPTALQPTLLMLDKRISEVTSVLGLPARRRPRQVAAIRRGPNVRE